MEGLNYRVYKGLGILFQALPYRMLRIFHKMECMNLEFTTEDLKITH